MSVVLGLTVAVSVAFAPRYAHAADKRAFADIHGKWTDPPDSCVDHITSFDPSTGVFTCTGMSVFTGTLVGSTAWTYTGHRDQATGVLTAQVREVFRGRAPHGRHGTLTLVEQCVTDAADQEVCRAHIVDGSGGLAGSRGHLRFTGQIYADNSATGTYSGRWRPGD